MSRLWKVGGLVAYKALSECVSKLAAFFILLLAARFLPPEAFGILSLGFLSGWLLGVASDFGLQIYLAREVSHLQGAGSSLFWPLFRWRLGAALLGLVILSACSVWFDWPGETAAFLLVTAAQLEAAVTEFVFHYFRGLERSELESSLQLAIRPAMVAAVGAGLIVHPGLLTVGLILCTVSTLGLVAALIVSRGLDLGSARSAPEVQSLRLGDSFREIAPIGFGILFSGLYFRVDLYLVEAWVGLQAVGLYNAVYRLVDALRLVPAAVLAVVFPRLCRETSTRTLVRVAVPLLIAASGLLLLLEWQAETVVRLTFGSRYLAAVPAFRILLLAVPLLYMNYLLTHQLIAWGRQWNFAVNCGLGLMMNLLLNLWLIPALGMTGAAWSTVLTELFLAAAWVVILVRCQIGLDSTSSTAEVSHVGT